MCTFAQRSTLKREAEVEEGVNGDTKMMFGKEMDCEISSKERKEKKDGRILTIPV